MANPLFMAQNAPRLQTVQFVTNKNGTFSPSITTSDSSIARWSVTGESNQTTNTPSFTLDGTDRTVILSIVDLSKISTVDFASQNIKGGLDLSELINCTSYDLNTNALLASVINPISATVITLYHFYSTGLTALDLSTLTGLGGSLLGNVCPNLTSITFPVSSEVFTLCAVRDCDLTGTIDLSGLTGLGGGVFFFGNANLTSVMFPTSSEVFTFCNFNDCDLTGIIDLSGLTGLGGQTKFNDNANLTDITLPLSSQSFSLIDIADTSIGVIDWTTLSGDIAQINLNSCSFTSAESDENIVSIDININLTVALNVAGTNGALTDGSVTGFDGLAAKASLEGKGVTVTAN